MVPWRASADGFVTPEVLAWYGRFAEGKPAALVVEATGIRDIASGPLLRIGDDRFVQGLATLVQTVRRRSEGATRLFIQLIDFLAIHRRVTPARYFAEFLRLRDEHRTRLAELTGDESLLTATEETLRDRLTAVAECDWPQILSVRELEDLRMGHRERVTDLDLPHIRDLPRALPPLFAAAAGRAVAAGFDGVELHYAHAYSMASFLSALNTRADGFGGNRDARLRLPLDVYEAVRAQVGGNAVVGCRFLGDEAIAGGSDVDDARQFALAFARAGFDYLSLSKGGKFEDARQPAVGQAAYPYTGPSGAECIPTIRAHRDSGGPLGRQLPQSRQIRATLRAAGLQTPVVAAGGITNFALAEGALARGDADICASARQTLADPDWFQKMRTGRGAEIRNCALTNYCEGLDQKHKKVTCRLWDRTPIADDEPAFREGHRRLVAPAWRRPS